MARKRKYTQDLVAEHIKNVTSWAGLIRSFGLKETGGNYVHMQRLAHEFGIDTSHFTGKGWSRGKTATTDKSVARVTKKIQKYADHEILVENAPAWIKVARLRKALFSLGREYKCEICGIDSWLGKPLTLHLDHKNGINSDHRPNNLRFLCPNCHQQTPTWGYRKKS